MNLLVLQVESFWTAVEQGLRLLRPGVELKVGEQYLTVVDVLSDSGKRAAYDQFGHAGVEQGAGGFHSSGFGDAFSDIFGDIFGGGGRSRVRKGADLQYNLELNLEDAVAGTTVKIRVPTLKHCTSCSGSGAKPGSRNPSDAPGHRPWPGTHATGFLFGAANLPGLSR